ncbi:MAG: hypothetical protein IH586_06215, partial [Anaerolineaceae bacterium]|nr:hypothetical protein [Anaerolineaceae bacterium]
MMGRQIWRFIVAGFLILLGVGILLSNLNILPWDITGAQWFWLLVFGGAGAAFVAVFLSNRENWWAVIPGFTLIGLAVLISNILPENGDAGAAIFLGMVGLSFWVIYAQKREFWWAIIPGGVLASLALMLLFSGLLGGEGEPAIFFLGMGVTFLLVYLLPNQETKMRWALWPAAILGFMGMMFTLGSSGLIGYIFPVALILFGGWLVFRAMNRKNQML